MTGKELERLMSEAAIATTGRNCVVLLEEPSLDYASAETTRTHTKAYIRLNPAGNYEALYESFCHEISHVLLDWNAIKPSNEHRRPSRSETKSPMVRKIIRELPFEKRAERVGKLIADFGRTKSYDVYSSDSDPAICGYLKGLIANPKLKGLVVK